MGGEGSCRASLESHGNKESLDFIGFSLEDSLLLKHLTLYSPSFPIYLMSISVSFYILLCIINTRIPQNLVPRPSSFLTVYVLPK